MKRRLGRRSSQWFDDMEEGTEEFLKHAVKEFRRKYGYLPRYIVMRDEEAILSVEVDGVEIPVQTVSKGLAPRHVDLCPVALKRKAVRFKGKREPVNG